MEMYSTHNEEKSVVPERLKEPERMKYRNAWLQYQNFALIDKLGDRVIKYHRTIHLYYNYIIKLSK